MEIKLKGKTISGAAIDNALSILRDYSIDEPEIVLEAICLMIILKLKSSRNLILSLMAT